VNQGAKTVNRWREAYLRDFLPSGCFGARRPIRRSSVKGERITDQRVDAQPEAGKPIDLEKRSDTVWIDLCQAAD